ncbi:MAG: hypothetical protein KF712_02160 [Akkermansiaceae bacterium]|nr:hypothetical protein [Akkermansiaceae bacterium]
MSIPANEAPSRPGLPRNYVSNWIIGISFALLVLPFIFFSSASWIAWPRLAALVLSLVLMRRAFPHGLPGSLKAMAVILLVIFASAWTGGMLNREIPEMETFMAVEGILAICGFTVFIKAVLSTGWSRFASRTFIVIAVVLLACSLAGYFMPIERMITMGPLTYFDTTRLILIWPTKMVMSWAGQLGWGHANHAGLIFGISFILILEHLASAEARHRKAWWLTALGFGAALFLTGSRGALLMIVPCLAVIMFRRGWLWNMRCTALCLAAFALGFGALAAKRELIRRDIPVSETSPSPQLPSPQLPSPQLPSPQLPPPQLPPPQLPPPQLPPPQLPPPQLPPPQLPPDHHLKGLVKRGSAGRVGAYMTLRDELKGSLWFGRGLSQNNRPLSHLLNEHSSYLATLRGGGVIALIGHGALLAFATVAAVRLSLRGTRWPLLLLAAVATGILFDRGSVFLVNASYEFPFHWAAVLLPVLMATGRSPIKDAPPPSSPDREAPRVPHG